MLAHPSLLYTALAFCLLTLTVFVIQLALQAKNKIKPWHYWASFGIDGVALIFLASAVYKEDPKLMFFLLSFTALSLAWGALLLKFPRTKVWHYVVAYGLIPLLMLFLLFKATSP
jgi:hypothetical protein